ncbi:MAG: hypothetical protein L3J18_10065 [Candidatus Brocadia sp.]|nr:MAG: hypothetical protein L3J18_10065 [Candidatus Brocadia sp.]
MKVWDFGFMAGSGLQPEPKRFGSIVRLSARGGFGFATQTHDLMGYIYARN